MEAATIPATRRELLGTKHTRRIRAQGRIPAIVYGHGEAPEPIALDAHEIDNILHHHSRVVTVDLDGRCGQYLIKAVQYDHLGTTPIHVDLVRVDLDERVRLSVEVELRGTPRGAAEGGILTQLLNEIEVECVVTAIPEDIRLAVTNLGLGESLLVNDLHLPPGVTVLTNPGEKIATCRLPAAKEEVDQEAEPEETEGATEPEVIGRSKEESAGENT